jgi:hypothetical protein
MQYNPYAPPQAAPPPQFGPVGGGQNAGPQPWSVGEALGVGWDALKVHGVTLVLTYVVAGLPGFAINQVANQITKGYQDPSDPMAVFQEPGFWAVTFGFSIPTMIIAAFFQGGLIKIWLAAARGQTPQFGDLFTGGRTFLSILGFGIVTQLVALFTGWMLLIPLIIWACGMSLAEYYMVDEGLGMMAAISKSWNATRGHKINIFVFGLAAFGVGVLGALACCIGLLAAYPIISVAMALIYTRISGNLYAPSGAAPPMGGAGGGGMGGGFGPTQPAGGFGGPPAPGYGAPPPAGGGYGGPPGY